MRDNHRITGLVKYYLEVHLKNDRSIKGQIDKLDSLQKKFACGFFFPLKDTVERKHRLGEEPWPSVCLAKGLYLECIQNSQTVQPGVEEWGKVRMHPPDDLYRQQIRF